MAEDAGAGVAELGVDKLPGYDSVTEEGLAWGLLMLYRGDGFENRTICEMGVGLAGIRGSVVPENSNQLHELKAQECRRHTIRLQSTSALPILPTCQALYEGINSHSPLVVTSDLTSIKRRHLPIIRLPKVLPLIQRPLRRASLADIGIIRIRHV